VEAVGRIGNVCWKGNSLLVMHDFYPSKLIGTFKMKLALLSSVIYNLLSDLHVNMQLDVAEECLGHAKDLSGLLLLYSAVGDAQGLEKLSVSARDNGKNNVAFVSLFLLGKIEECVELLIERYVNRVGLCTVLKEPLILFVFIS